MITRKSIIEIILFFLLFFNLSNNVSSKEMLFFAGSNDNSNWELWAQEETEKKPKLLKEMNNKGAGLNKYINSKQFITLKNKKIFFPAFDEEHGKEIWMSDGTKKGTILLKDINPGKANSSPGYFTVFKDKLFFRADDGQHGTELWMSDGTSEGTKLVKDINSGPTGSSPRHFTIFNNKFFFTADDGEHGIELWVYEGSEKAPELVKDIKEEGSGLPDYLTVYNNKLFFRADDGQHGAELWMSDGTNEGTKLVKDFYSGSYGSSPGNLTVFNNKLFYEFKLKNTFTKKLFVYDGTSNTHTPVKDKLNLDCDNPSELKVFNNKMFFKSQNNLPNGKFRVIDENPNSAKSLAGSYTATVSDPLKNSNDKLFFIGNVENSKKYKVWMINENGTEASAVTKSFDKLSHLTISENKLFFIAETFSTSTEEGSSRTIDLCMYDGNNVIKLKELIVTNNENDSCSINNIKLFNNNYYFIVGIYTASNYSRKEHVYIADKTLAQTDKLDNFYAVLMITADVKPAPSNNPPTSANTKFIISKENGKTFSASDFPFTDSDEGDSLDQIRLINPEGVSGDLKVKIESGYSERLSGEQDMNVADLNNLKFFPDENASPGHESSFSFKVSDGIDFSEQSYTCTLKINTPPSITSDLNTSAVADSKFTYDISTSDDDGQELNIKVKGDLPDWLNLNWGENSQKWKSSVFKENVMDSMTAVHEDLKGNIYVSSRGGKLKKIDADGKVFDYNLRNETSIYSITSDKSGKIYFTVFGRGLYHINDSGQSEYISIDNSLNKKMVGLFYDDESDVLYSAVYQNINRIIKINMVDKSHEHIAGNGGQGDAQENKDPLESPIYGPFSVIKNSAGNLYILARDSKQIIKLSKDKKTIEKVKKVSFPYYFCVDNENNIYFTSHRHTENSSKLLQKIDADFKNISTIYKSEKNLSGLCYTKTGDILVNELNNDGGSVIRLSRTLKGFTGTPQKAGTHKLTLVVSDGIDEVEKELTITVKSNNTPVKPQPVPPSPSPSPSAPEPDTGGPEIDSNDKNYESSSKKYQKDIKGTGSISGKIKIEKGSGKVKFKSPPLKGLTLNSDGSYKFDSSSYKDLKKGEKKTIKTPVTITDENGKTLKIIMEFEVTGENDAPEIKKINNVIKYKNFEETRIPVKVEDPDNDSGDLRYELEVDDPSLAEVSLDENNQIIVKAEPGASGTANIKLKISDGEKTSVMSFKVKVLSLEDGDNVDEAGDVEVEVEGDVTKTKVKVPEDKIEIETKEDESTGNVEYDLNQDNKKSHAKSELNGSIVEINNKGAKIVYEDENKKLKLNVSSTITGETTGKIEKNGNTTEFISKIPGGDTKIGEKDSRVEIETDLKVWETKEIKAVVGEDGSFKEEITVNGKTTRLSTKIPGSKTILDENESLKTNLELNKGSEGNIRKINAVAITDPKGESQTWFEENGKVLERTISEKTPLETGSEIEIIQNGSEVEFKIRTELTRELIIE